MAERRVLKGKKGAFGTRERPGSLASKLGSPASGGEWNRATPRRGPLGYAQRTTRLPEGTQRGKGHSAWNRPSQKVKTKICFFLRHGQNMDAMG